MKKIIVLLLMLILVNTITIFADTSVKVTYNDSYLISDVQPYIENSRTLIPVRMAEQLGYTVEWHEKTRTVTLEKGSKNILLTIDSTKAKVNDKTVTLDVPAKITESRTFVPVRFVSENFGYNVKWDNDTRTVVITDPVKSDSISITRVTTEKTQDKLLIKLFSDKPIEDVKVMTLEEPKRYVYDFPSSILTVEKKEIPINSDVVKSVRYSQFSLDPESVRFVVELNQETTVTAKYIDGIYTISVSDGGVPTVQNLKLTEGDNTASVFLTTDMTLNYTSYKLSNPSRYVIELPDADIAAKDVTGNGEVIKKAQLSRKDGITKLTVYLAGAVTDTKCYLTAKDGNIVVTVNKTSKTPEKPVNKDDFLIVIDPGHGGDEPGSLGMIDGKIALYEKDINLKIGKRVYEILLEKGYNVIATRTDDSTVSLMKRVEIANESKADLFVSVHNNSFEDSSAKGTLTMYAYDTPKEGMTFSGKEVASIIQPYLAEATGSTDRELMENPKIYVNAKTNMPAVLCECLFMSNPEDLKKLMDDTYAKKIAEGIAEGIEEAVKRMKQ